MTATGARCELLAIHVPVQVEWRAEFVVEDTEEAPMCSDWADEDVSTLHAIGARLGFDPVNLAKLMAHESGCSPHAVNWIYERDNGGKVIGKHAGAVGLLQFEPETLHGLGWRGTQEAFAALSVGAQLPFVERYLSPHAQYIAAGLGALYTAVFLPALLPHAVRDDFVLCGARGPLDWAYRSNATFDTAKKGWITPADLSAAAELFFAKSAAAQDLAARLRALDAPASIARVTPVPLPPTLDIGLATDDEPGPEAA